MLTEMKDIKNGLYVWATPMLYEIRHKKMEVVKIKGKKIVCRLLDKNYHECWGLIECFPADVYLDRRDESEEIEVKENLADKKVCKNCSTKYSKKAKFCIECGLKIDFT